MTKIDLPTHFEKFVEDQVAEGRFPTASDVVEAALQLLAEQQAEYEPDLAYMREKIRESLDDSRPSIPAEDVFRELEAKHLRRMAERG